MVFLDFEKAFDSLEWNFLFETLQKFGFKKNFLNWIKLIYNCPLALVKVNGFLTEHVNLARGIRQGCPLSALLFILCTEILATSIKQNENIKGLDIPFDKKTYKTVKLSQYADDMCLYLKDDQQLINAFDTILEFGKMSGLVLNIEKTEGLWLGGLENHNMTLFGIKFPGVIKYLGIYIGRDVNECNKKNWEDKLIIFQKLLDSWRLKSLTLYTKVNFLKTMALSKLVFIVQMQTTPTEILKRIEKLIFNFLWGKIDKIRRRSLICSMENGGLNMIDLNSFFLALKATWLHRLSCNRTWTYLAKFYLNKIAPSNILLKMNFEQFTEMPSIKMLPSFYQEVLLAYCKYNIPILIKSKNSLYNEIIWGNRQFKHNKICLYSHNMIEANFIYLRDIIQTNGDMKPTIYNQLKNKTTYFKDITLIIKILKEFKNVINSNEEMQEFIPANIEYKHVPSKSKTFYLKLKHLKELVPKAQSYWIREFPNYSFEIFYLNKIK